nr:unnamed protein product [Callosobruchus analis]
MEKKNWDFILLEGQDQEELRKMLEYIFSETNMYIEIFIRGNQKSRSGGEKSEEIQNMRRNIENDVLLLKAEGKTYAELLKAVMEVASTAEDSSIKAVRKSKKGEVLLTLERDKEKTKTLKTVIADKVNGVQVKTISKEETIIHTHNLDATVTEEDIRKAIRSSLQAQETDVPTQRENEIATIAIDREKAEKLIGDEFIKTCLNRCYVTKRLEIARCYKCHKYDHLARECTGPSRGNICLKCGESRHKASECEGEEYCVSCEVKGHRTGTLKFPVYRQMLAKQRKSGKGAGEGFVWLEMQGSSHLWMLYISKYRHREVSEIFK